jgi:hypothetical protein
MKTINKSDYSEIKYSVINNSVYMVWLPQSRHMSEWEFWEEIDTLFSTIEVFKAKLLYIDAYKYSFPINDKSISQINTYLTNCPSRVFDIVMSSNNLGKLSILRLIKKMNLSSFQLTLFKTREEGNFWYSLKGISIGV